MDFGDPRGEWLIFSCREQQASRAHESAHQKSQSKTAPQDMGTIHGVVGSGSVAIFASAAAALTAEGPGAPLLDPKFMGRLHCVATVAK